LGLSVNTKELNPKKGIGAINRQKRKREKGGQGRREKPAHKDHLCMNSKETKKRKKKNIK